MRNRITVELEAGVYDKLDQEAGKRGVPLAQVAREILDGYARATSYKLAVPLKGGDSFEIDRELLSDLETVHRGVDVPAELRKLIQWNLSNPGRRKTMRGVRRHIDSWLSRASGKMTHHEQALKRWLEGCR